MSWPTINDEVWDRFDLDNEQREADQLEAEKYEAGVDRKNREFYRRSVSFSDGKNSIITYEDGTVEIIDGRGIIQPNVTEAK